MPIPNVVCSTRSPATSDGISRIRGCRAEADRVPPGPGWPWSPTCSASWSTARSVRRQSTSWLGDLVQEPAGRVVLRGAPRRSGRWRGRGSSRLRARVMPTYASRRSSASSRWSLSDPLVREDAVLQPGQEDRVELQALRGVQRHQRDHAGVARRPVRSGSGRSRRPARPAPGTHPATASGSAAPAARSALGIERHGQSGPGSPGSSTARRVQARPAQSSGTASVGDRRSTNSRATVTSSTRFSSRVSSCGSVESCSSAR